MSHRFHLQKGLRPNSRIVYRFSLLIYRWWTNRTRLHWPIGLRAKKIHQTMVLDRQGSYTRPVIGLVRCVCTWGHPGWPEGTMHSLSATLCLWTYMHRYWRWMSHDILAWCHHLHFLGWNPCHILLLRWNQYVKALGPFWVDQDFCDAWLITLELPFPWWVLERFVNERQAWGHPG